MKSNHKNFDWHSFISDHPLFGELISKDISRLLDSSNSTQRAFKRDDVIFRAGEISNSFFLIGKGSVVVELSSEDSSSTNICTLYKGDYFGEMSAIDEKNGRAATIMANEACTLLEIKSKPFQKIIKANPELEFKLLSMLAARLRHVNDHLLKSTRLTYDTKFSLLSEKIESQSKVVEASLNASQAVFEQTKIRTTEIIDAAERGRSRITWVMSTLTVGFTLLLALFSFLGYDKLNTAEDALVKIKSAGESIEKTKIEIEESERIVSDAKENVEQWEASVDSVNATLAVLENSIKESEAAKRSLFKTLIPIFTVQVEEKIKVGNESEPEKLGLRILESNDDLVTIELFKKLFYVIETSLQDNLDIDAKLSALNEGQKEFSNLVEEKRLNHDRISFYSAFMYSYLHNANENRANNPLAHFLSNYILLVTYALDDEYAKDNDVYTKSEEYPRDNFYTRFRELNTKYTGVEGAEIKRKYGQEFRFELEDEGLTMNAKFKERKNLIDSIWD